MKKELVLFGASTLGEIAYIFLKGKYNIKCFCDNDQKKWGNFFLGLEIINPQLLINSKDIKVVITSTFHITIAKQLEKLGIDDYEIFNINVELSSVVDRTKTIKEINLGKFLSEYNTQFNIGEHAYLVGGSGVLDYVFLKALAMKFKLNTYLEIGTFLGESIACISEIVQSCYSISLPDEDLDNYFLKFKKRNFSRFFSRGKNNIIHFYENSHFFDYGKIKEKIDLVFIDGDHSYLGILTDTINIFNFIDQNSTFVVWHDFKDKGEYRINTINAIYEGVPKELQNNIFGVDNNICAVYIPEKYISAFNSESEIDTLYSYNSTLKININKS